MRKHKKTGGVPAIRTQENSPTMRLVEKQTVWSTIELIGT
jgi:hypothetical protein